LQELGFFSLLSLLVSGLSFLTENDVAILGQVLFILVVILAEVLAESFEFGGIFLSDVSDSDATGELLVDQLTETGLALDKAVGNILVAAEVGEPDNEFDRVNVVSNHNKFRLTLLNESGDVVQATLQELGFGSLSLLLRLAILVLGRLDQTGLLLGTSLRLVLGQKLKEGFGLVGRERVGELVNDGRDLETFEKNSLLALEEDVAGPLDEAGHVALGLDVSADLEDTFGAFEEIAELLVLLYSLGASHFLLGLTFSH
jgi:hypothetical protein